jgi:pteridine reductase
MKLQNKTAFITGAAKRIGAEISRSLHADGMNIVIHYRFSKADAENLCNELNARRADSAIILQADILNIAQLDSLVQHAAQYWGQLDVLINNASSFYATVIGNITEVQWDDLIGSNLKAPLFLSQAAAPYLQKTQGCIINILDVHGFRPMKEHPVYCIAKAGLAMLTQSLARELGPEIRVNGVAPGAIIWPTNELDSKTQQDIIQRTSLKRQGNPADIAAAVKFLIRDAGYITGQIIPVDGGRSLNI